MLKRLAVLSAALFAAVALSVSHSGGPTNIRDAHAVPDPVTCTGYPEPRIYLENQSWWEPQEADFRDPDHPGVGAQGHIHVGTCFPLHQNIVVDSPDDVLHFDVRVQYHNITGYTNQFRADMYGDRNYDVPQSVWDTAIKHCDVVDCDDWVSFDLPLGTMDLQFGGVHELDIYPIVWESQNGQPGPWEKQYNITRWYVNVVNGMPDPPVGSVAANVQINQNWIGGDSWYNPASGGQYARAGMLRADLPWNEVTGALVPVSGIWAPQVRFEKPKQFVYIDPALHANPPSFGTVVWDLQVGPTGWQTISIDTTQLTNGIHRLLIGSANVAADGTHSGTGVISFLVDNDPCS